MYIDSLLLLSDAQALTTTAASTNVVDMLADGQAIEPGAWLKINVTTDFDLPGTTATLTAQLQTGDDANMANGVTLVSSASIIEADLVSGKEVIAVKIPKGLKRFLRVWYILTGTATAGVVDANIVSDVDHLITDGED